MNHLVVSIIHLVSLLPIIHSVVAIAAPMTRTVNKVRYTLLLKKWPTRRDSQGNGLSPLAAVIAHIQIDLKSKTDNFKLLQSETGFGENTEN